MPTESNQTAKNRNNRRLRALRSKIGPLAALAIVTVLTYVAMSPPEPRRVGHGGPDIENAASGSPASLVSVGSALRTQLLRATAHDGVRLDGLSFSTPGEEAEANPGERPPGNILVPGRDELAALVDGTAPPAILITLSNRIAGAGGNDSDLVAVLQFATDEACQAALRDGEAIANPTPLPVQSIDLTPFPKQAAVTQTLVLPRPAFGCIRTHDGAVYVHVLLER